MRLDRWTLPLAMLGLLAFAPPSFALEDADDEGEKAVIKAPKAVKKAVKAAYPKAKIRGISREKNEEGETVYEVELTVKGQNVDLIVDEEGEIEETEKAIDPFDLPGAVLRSIKAKFPKALIEKAEELTLEDDKVLFEVILILKGKESFEVVIAPNGKIIEKQTAEAAEGDEKAKKAEDEDEDDDEKPKAKKKGKGESKQEMDDEEDEDDDEKPKAKKKGKGESKQEMDDEEDEDEKPKAKKKGKGESKQEMDDEEDEDEDEKPKAKKKGKGESKQEMDDEEDEDDDEKA